MKALQYLTVNEVQLFLTGIGLGEFNAAFSLAQINGEHLAQTTSQVELKELGIYMPSLKFRVMMSKIEAAKERGVFLKALRLNTSICIANYEEETLLVCQLIAKPLPLTGAALLAEVDRLAARRKKIFDLCRWPCCAKRGLISEGCRSFSLKSGHICSTHEVGLLLLL